MPVTYPLGPPSVSGNNITVDEALANPTRITRDIADLVMQRFFADRIFSSGGGVSGGAILFERPNVLTTDLYAARDVQEVAPGSEFPVLTFSRGVPMVARPRKIGGKFAVTKEARLRNDARLVQRAMQQTANTIRRRAEQMALAEIAAVSAAETRSRAGISWSAAVGLTDSTRTRGNEPLADLVESQELADLEERGHVYNGVVLHPTQMSDLVKIYGALGVGQMFNSVGITEWFSTPRQTAGRALLYEAAAVGEWRNEFPLLERVWEDDPHEQTWYQWSISPAMFVDNPFAFLEVTGIA